MIITILLTILCGIGFLGYGVFQLLLKKICTHKVQAVFSPENVPPRKLPFYVYTKDGKEVYAYQQNLTVIGTETPVRGEAYDVYVSPRFPSLLITSENIPAIQFMFAICCIIIGVVILGIVIFIIYAGL